MAGSKMLKVCGILFIIFGAISVVVSILAVIGAAAGIEAANNYAAQGYNMDSLTASAGIVLGAVIAAAIFSLVGSALELVAGILGVKNWKKPEKATVCVVFGIIVLALTVISLILAIIGGGTSTGAIVVSIISGLALPVLYLIGALQLKKQAAPKVE